MNSGRAVAWPVVAAAVLKVWLRYLHREFVGAAPRRTARPKRIRWTPPVTE